MTVLVLSAKNFQDFNSKLIILNEYQIGSVVYNQLSFNRQHQKIKIAFRFEANIVNLIIWWNQSLILVLSLIFELRGPPHTISNFRSLTFGMFILINALLLLLLINLIHCILSSLLLICQFLRHGRRLSFFLRQLKEIFTQTYFL